MAKEKEPKKYKMIQIDESDYNIIKSRADDLGMNLKRYVKTALQNDKRFNSKGKLV